MRALSAQRQDDLNALHATLSAPLRPCFHEHEFRVGHVDATAVLCPPHVSAANPLCAHPPKTDGKHRLPKPQPYFNALIDMYFFNIISVTRLKRLQNESRGIGTLISKNDDKTNTLAEQVRGGKLDLAPAIEQAKHLQEKIIPVVDAFRLKLLGILEKKIQPKTRSRRMALA
jgi:hypothetical protein